MDNAFFQKPILNSPYAYPRRHWELDEQGQPTQRIIDDRRKAEFISPIPRPRKQKGAGKQANLLLDQGQGLSTEEQQYNNTALINAVRSEVEKWRNIPHSSDWRVTPETARLLQYWRHHAFSSIRPFFCQIEAVETAIWLIEVAPQMGKAAQLFLDQLNNASQDTNPGLLRLALKLATGAGKTLPFGQLKRIARQWLDGYLTCKGGTYPAQLKYKMLADMAASRIITAINRAMLTDHSEAAQRHIHVVLDPYNPSGSTTHVNFNTSKTERWDTSGPPPKCHLNWVILDSDWEGEFCRVVEAHPRVRAYVKNHNLGFEVPYRYGSESRIYRPDFIVRVDDGHGENDLLNLIVEIKGYRGEDAKDKKATMDTYWVPGVNNLGSHGRWAFAEFTDVWLMQEDFVRQIALFFDRTIASVVDSHLSGAMP